MGFLALDVDDKPDPAGVLLLFRVIKALLRWKPGYLHHAISFSGAGDCVAV
jgi:hypothetical protein